MDDALTPAPLTPVFESITILSTKLFLTNGYDDKIAPVGKQPGFATKLAFLISSLYNSGSPKAPLFSLSVCSIPYHFS